MFKNRIDAGEKLAEELKGFSSEDVIIVGIPRGGALVAQVVAKHLNKPWDIIVPRKIGAPFQKEVAIGAVTQDGTYILNNEIIRYYNISEDYINNEIKVQTEEIKRRLIKYKRGIVFPDVEGKTVIIVDDGIATGYTIAAAIESIKSHKTQKIILAVPVASLEAIDMLKKYVDEVVCIEMPKPFLSVGSSYQEFEQNDEEEIINLFSQSSQRRFV